LRGGGSRIIEVADEIALVAHLNTGCFGLSEARFHLHLAISPVAPETSPMIQDQ